MNVTESTHVQHLLRWLTDRHLTDAEDDQAAALAGTAAAYLADAAHRRLGAGPTGAHITAAWADRLTTCPGCHDCTPDRPDDDHAEGADGETADDDEDQADGDQAEADGDRADDEDRAGAVRVAARMWEGQP